MLAPTLTQAVELVRLFKHPNSLGPYPSVAWQSSSPRSLNDLPPELLAAICLFADWKTILGCRAVCRRLKDVVDNSVELQYCIELALNGMIDGPFSSLSPGERLTRLRALRRSWSTLSWTSQMKIPMPGMCSAYELVGGIFCKTQPGVHPNANWDGQPSHLHVGHTVGSKQMSVTFLPSTHDAERTVVCEDLVIPTRDFAMDPSQDLMVLFKGGEDTEAPMVVFPGALELHIRTMSTNRPHPKARVPVLCTPVLFPVTSAFIQIVDDVVGMMYCVDPSRPRVTIWNWKTGHLVVDRSSTHLPHGTWDFSFITRRAFFVTSGSGYGSIEIFTFSCDHTEAQSSADPLTHVASLYLPSILPTVRVLSVETHTGPFLASCPEGKPFTASNQDRIHVLTIQYINLPTIEGPRARPRLCIILHNKALEGYIARYSNGPPASVPWGDWGRANTRVLPHIGLFQWLRYVHGQRLVILPHDSEPGKSILQVLDFNVFNTSTLRDLHNSDNANDEDDKDDASVELVDFPTRIGMPNIFSEVLESALPFWEARKQVCTDYSGMMIDDERLVGLKYPAFLTGDMKEIDVFTM